MNFDEKLKITESAIWDHFGSTPADSYIVEEGWVQSIGSEAPAAFLSGVYRCELDESVIDDRIAKTIAEYKKLNANFRWKVTASSRPKSLASKLKAHGLFHKETLLGLYADPKELAIKGNPEVQIKELSCDNLEDWLSLQELTWSVPPQAITFMREKMRKELESGNPSYVNFLAYINDKPIASAALGYQKTYASLVGASVDPTHRGKGVYKSLLAHRLELLKARGLPAVIHCLESTSAPICLKLGFEKVVTILSFENTPLDTKEDL